MAKVIVYKNSNNSIEVLRPGTRRKQKETEIAYLSRIAESTFPGRPYVITELTHGWNRKESLDAYDSLFRNCWTLDRNNNISIDLNSAKKIWIDIIRSYRNKALKTLDIEFMSTIADGDFDSAKEIEDIKKILRDLPKTIERTTFNSLNELKSYWPVVLLPAPKFVL
jgi:hypothetical protein